MLNILSLSALQEIYREQYGQYSHAATGTKRYCVTIEVSSLGKFIEYINDGTNILNNKIPWLVHNHETGL